MMKKLCLIVVLLFVAVSNAQKEEVQKTIETFFKGFHSRDTIKIQSVCSDKLILQSIKESDKGNQLTEESVNGFYLTIEAIPAELDIEERILSYNIQIDGTMAHAWTPYEFYINGKLNHTGVNAFTLYNDKGQWKIIYLIDTRRK